VTKILAVTAIAAALVLPVATPASAFTISLPFFRISIALGVGPSYRHASRPSVRHARRATPERVATSRHEKVAATSRPRPEREAPPARASEPTTMGGDN
jgi:hypothetical protein